jgi:hypothetical protein
MRKMNRLLTIVAASLLGIWMVISFIAGWVVLPGMLLHAPLPMRTEAERVQIRDDLLPQGCAWTSSTVPGGAGKSLEVWELHRPLSKGVAVLLHGFGDDAWGPAPRLRDLPDWNVVTFTFRGRDHDASIPSTLGGWEADDVVAVVGDLIRRGVPRRRILLVGASQGAGVALLALNKIEKAGGPLGGALLESPFESLEAAARNHIRGTLGHWEILLLPAEKLALFRAGLIAHFNPWDVSPLTASATLITQGKRMYES